MLSLLPWTIPPLPSLLSAHSFLVMLPRWIDVRYTFSLLTSGKKSCYLLWVSCWVSCVLWVVLVEDIEAVTMLYFMHCLWDARWICSFLSVFSNLKDLSQIFFLRHREILVQFIEQGSTTKTYHSLQSPHGYLFISSYILESIDQNMSKSHVNMKLSFASRKPIAELFSQY